MSDVFEMIKDDWKSIPQNNRYFILTGSTLLFIDWATDHWGRKYSLYGKDFHQWFFNAGITLILLGFVLILLKQFFNLSLLTHYRTIYSIDKVNKSFSLVLFNGRMILFDKRKENKKESYHIANSHTANDLGFWGSEYPVDMSYSEAVQKELNLSDPININVKDYKYIGQIKTRD